MTSNPLARRRIEPDYGAPPAMSAQEWCDHRNATMARDDIEWVVNSSGQPALQDRLSWQARHTKDMARKAESDRRQHAHRTRYPMQEESK